MEKFIKHIENLNISENKKNTTKTIEKKPVFSINKNLFGKGTSLDIKKSISNINKKQFYQKDDTHIHIWKFVKSNNIKHISVNIVKEDSEIVKNIKLNKQLKQIQNNSNCDNITIEPCKNGYVYLKRISYSGKLYCKICNKKYNIESMIPTNHYREMYEIHQSIEHFTDHSKITPIKLPYEFLECSCKENYRSVCHYCLNRGLKIPYSLSLPVINDNSENLNKYSNYYVGNKIELDPIDICRSIINDIINDAFESRTVETTVVYDPKPYIPWNKRPTRTQLYKRHLGLNDDDSLPKVYSTYHPKMGSYPMFIELSKNIGEEPIFNKYGPIINNKKTIQFLH